MRWFKLLPWRVWWALRWVYRDFMEKGIHIDDEDWIEAETGIGPEEQREIRRRELQRKRIEKAMRKSPPES